MEVVGFMSGRLRRATAKPVFSGLWKHCGPAGGPESWLLGIISVCFTVAVTHAVARCEVGELRGL